MDHCDSVQCAIYYRFVPKNTKRSAKEKKKTVHCLMTLHRMQMSDFFSPPLFLIKPVWLNGYIICCDISAFVKIAMKQLKKKPQNNKNYINLKA